MKVLAKTLTGTTIAELTDGEVGLLEANRSDLGAKLLVLGEDIEFTRRKMNRYAEELVSELGSHLRELDTIRINTCGLLNDDSDEESDT